MQENWSEILPPKFQNKVFELDEALSRLERDLVVHEVEGKISEIINTVAIDELAQDFEEVYDQNLLSLIFLTENFNIFFIHNADYLFSSSNYINFLQRLKSQILSSGFPEDYPPSMGVFINERYQAVIQENPSLSQQHVQDSLIQDLNICDLSEYYAGIPENIKLDFLNFCINKLNICVHSILSSESQRDFEEMIRVFNVEIHTKEEREIEQETQRLRAAIQRAGEVDLGEGDTPVIILADNQPAVYSWNAVMAQMGGTLESYYDEPIVANDIIATQETSGSHLSLETTSSEKTSSTRIGRKRKPKKNKRPKKHGKNKRRK